MNKIYAKLVLPTKGKADLCFSTQVRASSAKSNISRKVRLSNNPLALVGSVNHLTGALWFKGWGL